MSPITVLDNEHITISYLPDKKIIYHTVHKPISGQVLRDSLLAGYEALQHYGATKWLSDDRQNGPMSDEDREWGEINLNRRSMEAGWKYWALVVPQVVAAAGSMASTMTSLYELGLRMMVFTELEPAFEWLDSLED